MLAGHWDSWNRSDRGWGPWPKWRERRRHRGSNMVLVDRIEDVEELVESFTVHKVEE